MAFLRVVRDKRGYDTTYLIESTAVGSRYESRVLYAFRSPAGVRVGRDAFDATARRALEAGYPDVSFDWPVLLAERQVIDAGGDPRRTRRRGSDEGGESPAGGVDRARSGARPSSARAPGRSAEQAAAPRLQVPSIIVGETPEERLRFLAHWHGILCEQLPVRIQDVSRRDALLSIAQHLNPAGWIDADEIAAGLQRAAEALEALSRALSRRRRKSKTGGPSLTRGASVDGVDALGSPSDAETSMPSEPGWHESTPALAGTAEEVDAAPRDDAEGA